MWIQTSYDSWINSDHVREFYVYDNEIRAYFDKEYKAIIDICENENSAISELTQIMSKIMQGSKAITYVRLKALNDKKGIENDFD